MLNIVSFYQVNHSVHFQERDVLLDLIRVTTYDYSKSTTGIKGER